jgi:hypothetical protein
VRKCLKKRTLGKLTWRSYSNVKIGLTETEYENMNNIEMAQNGAHK